MTEQEIRKKYVACAETYLGARQGGAKHKDIVAVYNTYQPHPRGYILTMSAPWCAAFVSACAIIAKLTDIIPVECSCGEQISLWQSMGRWMETDSYVPSIGDLLYYDWEDDGEGDCTGAPNHVGIVTDVDGSDITVIEGNKGNDHIVGYRHLTVDGRYIRGYGLPDYASKATDEPETPICKSGYCLAELPILQRGARGEAVRAMQTLLNLRFGWQLKVDGSFGPTTERALKSFQETKKIQVDGSCGPVTWAKLVSG